MFTNKPQPVRGHVCTIGNIEYLPQISAFLSSVQVSNPSLKISVLLIDQTQSELGSEPVFFSPHAFVAPDRLQLMQSIYDVTELATALKPFFLRHLLAQSGEPVIYLDPDTIVCGDLSDLFEPERCSKIGLTPHVLNPFPRDDYTPTEQHIMRAGIFNLGFIRVSRAHESFLDWWSERLVTDSQVDFESGLFTDQRWIDWVPSLFPTEIIKDSGLNVAYWNLHERHLDVGRTTQNQLRKTRNPRELTRLMGEEVRVNGKNLFFFHFSGVDTSNVEVISRHMGPRPRPYGRSGLIAVSLIAAYVRCLRPKAGQRDWVNDSRVLSNSTSSGLQLLNNERAELRRRVAFGSEQSAIRLLANFLPSTTIGPSRRRKTRIEKAFGLLKNTIRSLLPKVSQLFRRLLVSSNWSRKENFNTSLLISPVSLSYSSAAFGVGQAGQRLRKVLRLTFPGLETIDLDPDSGGIESGKSIPNFQKIETLFLSTNADQTHSALGAVKHFGAPGRVIANWHWELSAVPTWFDSATRLVDEIWVTSEFQRAALAASINRPVRLISLPLFDSAIHEQIAEEHKDLYNDTFFRFLSIIDLASVFQRKNPIGVIEAFTLAFPKPGRAELVMKLSGHEKNPEAVKQIRLKAAGRNDIRIITRTLTQYDLQKLIRESGAFVSLHRSEGLGLNISDAMAHGLPTIVTNYGGCTDFVSETTAFPISFHLAPVGDGSWPYNPLASWAEPDLDDAVATMRFVAENPDQARYRGMQGRDLLQKTFGIEIATESIRRAFFN